MFDIGFFELILVAVVALLVLGPERLPVAARTAGKWFGRARRMVTQFTTEIDRQLKVEELREKLTKEGESLDIEGDIKKIQATLKSAFDDVNQTKPLENTTQSTESVSGAANNDAQSIKSQ